VRRLVRRRGLPAAAVVVVCLFGWAGTAWAHAAVVSSSPAQGEHVARDPGTVRVVFDQPVKPDDGGLIVLDSSGTRVSTASGHPQPDMLTATLPASAGNGAFVANYTVTSVDGHVVSGGIVFLVGHASASSIGQLARHTPALPKAVDDAGQFLIYLGVLVAGGLAFFLAFILRTGRERRRLGRACAMAAGVGVVGMVTTAAGQAALLGGSWGTVGQWSVLSQALGGKFGAQSAVQLAGLALCLLSLRLVTSLGRQFAAFYGLVISAGAFVIFGHALASADHWVTGVADVVHVVFAGMWIGGLAGLVVVLRSRVPSRRVVADDALMLAGTSAFADASVRPLALGASGGGSGSSTAVLDRPSTLRSEGDRGELRTTAEIVGRFSTMAGISVAVLLVAGTVLAVALVGSVDNLIGTSYGHLLLIKIAVVGALLFMAAYNRVILLPFLFSGSAAGAGPSDVAWGWRRLKATVRVEAIGVVVVLIVTTLLANGTPSNGATVAAPVVFSQSQPFDGGHVALTITPNQALINNFVVQFTGPDGAPKEMAESVSVYLVLPADNVGPIETDMKKVGVGRFALSGSPDPPIIGVWQLVLQIQVSEFSQPNVSFVDHVQ
jgi:copper transport protein